VNRTLQRNLSTRHTARASADIPAACQLISFACRRLRNRQR
jgi:hypothetical protein